VTTYDLFRRRIAPVAFALAIVLLARESCHKGERARATFAIDFGAAQAQVTAVDAELWTDDQQLAVFQRNALHGGTIGKVHFEAALPGKEGEMRIDVDAAGKHHHLVRHVHAEEGSTVVVPIGDELK
jgi:hypothetical protein